MRKVLYDMRGSQFRIFRLLEFDQEAFIHMLFYRILIFASMLYGAVLLLSFAYSQLIPFIKAFTVIIWILFTPTFFETMKGVSMVMSKGLAFGHLGDEYTALMRAKYKRSGSLFVFIPYIAILIWAAGFVTMIMWWSI